MTTPLKILLISLILSLPFWWAMNILADSLEDFFLYNEIAKNPEVFIAQVSAPQPPVKAKEPEQIFDSEEKKSKVVQLLVDNLENRTKSAISVEIVSKGREKILFEKNSNKPLPIASLSKLMTALVVFELNDIYDLSQSIEISKEAVMQIGVSKYGELKQGEYLSVETLLYIMLIESSNDAAYAVTELIGQEEFVELMNFYAEEIGLEHTQFINSTGLELDEPSSPKNFSTAKDLVKLVKYILDNHPQIFEITIHSSYEVLNTDGSLHHFIPQNTNILLKEMPEIIGGKTGWSPISKGCLLLVIDNPLNNSYYINVILGAEDRFAEMRKLIKLANEN